MSKIESLYEEWMSLQPLKAEDKNRLEQKFMLEFNYNSNHIEGNTLTYGQTEMLLMFDKVVDDADMKDLEEMKASNVGLKIVKKEALDKEQPLTEFFIRSLHQTLLREDYAVSRQLPDGSISSYVVHAGQYKTRPNSVQTITGEIFEYATPEETPALMKDLIEWYNEEEKNGTMKPIELASLFHYRYIRIHPFEDGNGRISRLIVNYILYRHGYPMIVVKTKDKKNYLTALNRCDIEVGPVPSDGAHAELSQITPFVDYMRRCLESALIICIKGAKGESIEDDDDWRKNIKLKYRNKLNKPEVTEKLKIKIPQEDFISLLEYIDQELSEFYSIFYSVNWAPSCNQYCQLKIKDSDPDMYFSVIHLEKGFKDRTFRFSINIELTMYQYLYRLKVYLIFEESQYVDIVLYDKEFSYLDVISDEVKYEVVTEIGKFINQFLETEGHNLQHVDNVLPF